MSEHESKETLAAAVVTAMVNGKNVAVESFDPARGIVRLAEIPPKNPDGTAPNVTIRVSGIGNVPFRIVGPETPHEATDIPPALTDDEWLRVRSGRGLDAAKADGFLAYLTRQGSGGNPSAAAALLIALSNAALPDEDPRKLTRETVAVIRAGAGAAEIAQRLVTRAEQIAALGELYSQLHEIADVLESYLPPVEPT